MEHREECPKCKKQSVEVEVWEDFVTAVQKCYEVTSTCLTPGCNWKEEVCYG